MNTAASAAFSGLAFGDIVFDIISGDRSNPLNIQFCLFLFNKHLKSFLTRILFMKHMLLEIINFRHSQGIWLLSNGPDVLVNLIVNYIFGDLCGRGMTLFHLCNCINIKIDLKNVSLTTDGNGRKINIRQGHSCCLQIVYSGP